MGKAVKHTPAIYGEIKAILESARSQAFRAVNFAMVQAYWNIGRVIVEEEQRGKARAEYGEYLLKDMSERLTKDFGQGFDYSNLKNMRQFYLTFPIGDALRSQLSWTHYRLLMRLEKESAREFYLQECISANWSTRQLERQINSFYYERLLASRDRKPVKAEIHEVEPGPTLEDIIRDPYVLEFLNLKDTPAFREKELESALIGKLQEFMLELGKGFSFVARQKRFTFDGQHFFIDLVFYNYMLKCFVLIDLKVGTLSHQDLGQMQMYVNYYTREMRNEGDNPPIGIILCADKSDAVVRYTLPEGSTQIFASRYKLYMPTEEELRAEIIRDRDMIERERRLRE